MKKKSEFAKWFDSKSSNTAWSHILNNEKYKGMRLCYLAGYRAAMRKKGGK